MKVKYRFNAHNLLLMTLVIMLNIVGILVLRSAAANDTGIVFRQIIGSLTGIVACLVISLIDYNLILKHSKAIYLATIVLLLMVLLLGIVRGGASRWIVLPLIGQVQPAEFAKFSLVLFFAAFFEKNKGNISDFRTLIRLAVLIGIPLILIVTEPNLSTTIIVGVIFVIMLYACGLELKLILLFTSIAVGILFLIIYLFKTGNYNLIPFMRGYMQNRILGFLFPDQYSEIFHQQANSIIAIGSGGFFGKGLNNTAVNSVKAGNFLIEEDTDFIFAIMGEELGFRGCFAILIVYLFTLFIILRIGGRSKDIGGAAVCIGITTWIGFQTFTNIAVATAVFPNTGVTLPFISRGVSSLLSLYMAIGVIMNIGYQSRDT